MTSQNNLEIKGNLQTNPLADLLAEADAANLTGSLRLTRETQKAVVYLNHGKPVFAVSNARRHRLFEILLQTNRVSKEQLAEIPNFTNDMQLAEALKTKGSFSKSEIDENFSLQIEEILKTSLTWMDGEWIFSPLTRVKENIQFPIEYKKLLLEHSRNLPQEITVKRFKSFYETFGASPAADFSLELLPQEAFVLSRFEKSFLKIEEVKTLSGLPDVVTLQILYTLWLGGFLYRQNWNPAFSDRKISEINTAKLSLKKEEIAPDVKTPISKPAPKASVQPVANKLEEETAIGWTLEEYLKRAEDSASYYEFFDIATDASPSDIKRAYFSLARRFHPDKFHQEKDVELLQRIQDAFTLAAHAYETLKNDETRKTYDYKLSKHLATLKLKDKPGKTPEAIKDKQIEMAKEAFEDGFELLMEDEYEEALPFLARAVQLAPDNARYHAFYGKALSSDESQRFKADAEMQSAVRLDPQNATFRIILAEFYIQFELFKRAEGELQRLLAIHPNHKEALALLDSLPVK